MKRRNVLDELSEVVMLCSCRPTVYAIFDGGSRDEPGMAELEVVGMTDLEDAGLDCLFIR